MSAERPTPASDGSAQWGPRIVRVGRWAGVADAVGAQAPRQLAALREYLIDVVAPYNLALRADPAERSGQSYGEIGEALIRAVVRPDEPVNVLLLAFSTPDVRPGRATATYLSHLCPGRPLGFAICDQGAAAGFTALRLAGEFLRGGDVERVLVIVAEQAVLHHAPVAAVTVPARHAAVALLCARSGPSGVLDVRVRPGVSADGLPAVLGPTLTTPSTSDHVLLAGAGLAAAVTPAAGALVAAMDQPGTGVWWLLAGLLAGDRGDAVVGEPARDDIMPAAVDHPAPGRPRRVVLADYEPLLRYACEAVVIPGASSDRPAAPSARRRK